MATTTFRYTDSAGHYPTRLSLPMAANTLCPKGTIVQKDGSGNAITGADANGFPAMGVSAATFDNRTGSEAGGLAGNLTCEIECGIFAFDVDGSLAPGDTCWVKDNETVSDDSASGTRGVAGVVHEVQTVRGRTQAYVWISPEIVDLFSDDSALGTAVTTAQSDIDALNTDALSAHAKIDIDVLSALVLATGVAVSAAAPSGAAPGTAVADSKSAVVKWLANATPDAIALNIAIPADLDDTKDVIFHAQVSKSGATLLDATKLTVAAFEIVPGALHDADTDFGGDTGAVVGDATAKTVTELTRTLGAADIHAYAESINLQIKPKAGTLGTDNFYLHSAWLEYTRKLRTS